MTPNSFFGIYDDSTHTLVGVYPFRIFAERALLNLDPEGNKSQRYIISELDNIIDWVASDKADELIQKQFNIV